MAKFTIERATIEHIEHVACPVREADVEELSAAAGITPLEAMLTGEEVVGGVLVRHGRR